MSKFNTFLKNKNITRYVLVLILSLLLGLYSFAPSSIAFASESIQQNISNIESENSNNNESSDQTKEESTNSDDVPRGGEWTSTR